MISSIWAENLSKQYRIGQIRRETTLREALSGMIRHPLRNLHSQTDVVWAVRDISFEVPPGQVVGIIGRNGAGKSTLLKLLSKITYPTIGKFKVSGRAASLLEVGTGFHSELTGRENIYLNGSILGMKKKEIDRKLDAIISFAGVEKFIDTPIKRYSSGMELRLGFAVAAHLEPDVLFVDEVLAVGDSEFQKKCLSAMEEMRSGGRTVLFVSHNMAAVENLCSRAIWIDNGRIRMDGKSKEVITAYLSTYSALQQSDGDLRMVANRRGTGEIRYTRIEFLDLNRRPKHLICGGEPLVVRLHYHADKAIHNPHFNVSIFTDLGTKVTEMNTWHSGRDISLLEAGDGFIDLEIEFLNLVAARYYITLLLETVGPIHFDVLDRCAILDVEVSDVYQSGRRMDSRFGVIYLPCRWVLHEHDHEPVGRL